MTEPTSPQQEPPHYFGEGARFLLTAAAAVIVIYGLQAARSVILPILMASFLAIISYSITKLLSKYLRFPHWLAVAATVAADGGILFGVGSVINFLAADMKATLQGEFTVRMVEKYNELMHWLGNFGWRNRPALSCALRRICLTPSNWSAWCRPSPARPSPL